MATVGGYHLFALSCATSIHEYGEGISHSRVSNELGGAYRSSLLLGSENGERRFRLQMPTLAALSVLPNTVTGINGESLSREEYVWDLYCETRVTNTPFVIQSQRDGQYFLVDFADEELTYERMRVKIYSTGLELKQRRIRGVTVFDIAQSELVHSAYDDQTWYDGGPEQGWYSSLGTIADDEFLVQSGDVGPTGTQNGLQTLQFNVTTNDGYLSHDTVFTLKEAFLVMKMREATFSNFAGVLTRITSDAAPVLLGDNGTTKFYNNAFGNDFQYWKNGVEFPESNMQAPMNAWGIIRIRAPLGIAMNGLQLGHDRAEVGRYAEMDAAHLIVSENLLPNSLVRQVYEHLATKWSINVT